MGEKYDSIKLFPREVCPYGSNCSHKYNFFDVRPVLWEGLNPDRAQSFVCDLDPQTSPSPATARVKYLPGDNTLSVPSESV
jgi:hypothetical protein